MEHIETLTRYTGNFVDELTKSGVTDAVISPGSRSTPLALTLTEHPAIKEWVVVDERSASFFALGLAKQTKRPVVLVCTSGTAAANYYPAIVEAHHSRVPLIVLTADRPHELRDVGAPQAIDQIRLFGDYAKWFQEMALPEATPEMLNYVRNKAARAAYMALEGNQGPVHLNFPFREPLTPDFSLKNIWSIPGQEARKGTAVPAIDGIKRLGSQEIKSLVDRFAGKRGVIVCGPQPDQSFSEAVTELAGKWGLPILADPLSQVRAGSHHKDHIIESYDAFMKNKQVRNQLKPDFIIRFGAMPVSKMYLFYLKEHSDAEQLVVENHAGYREPAGNVSEFIFSDPSSLCRELAAATPDHDPDTGWLNTWQDMNRIAKKHLLGDSEAAITEGEAVRALSEAIPECSTLYVGNSMAIRDVDTFFMTTPKAIEILANRGANGIDGMVSSGAGAAAAAGKPVTLLLGDLSFFHDMNGLLAVKHYNLDLTILLVNNNGGGIFSFLPQAKDKKHFEALFGTPVDLEFRKAIEMYGGEYAVAATESELKERLYETYQRQGLKVIEVRTDREENVIWHRRIWQAIEEEILQNGD